MSNCVPKQILYCTIQMKGTFIEFKYLFGYMQCIYTNYWHTYAYNNITGNDSLINLAPPIFKLFTILKKFFFFFSFRWYRDGSSTPLTATTTKGGSKDHQTTSTLKMTPRREDDGAKFRCAVSNRAMSPGQRLETTVTLSVNCKYNTVFFYNLHTLSTTDNDNQKYLVTINSMY